MTKFFYREAQIGIVVYDVTQRDRCVLHCLVHRSSPLYACMVCLSTQRSAPMLLLLLLLPTLRDAECCAVLTTQNLGSKISENSVPMPVWCSWATSVTLRANAMCLSTKAT